MAGKTTIAHPVHAFVRSDAFEDITLKSWCCRYDFRDTSHRHLEKGALLPIQLCL